MALPNLHTFAEDRIVMDVTLPNLHTFAEDRIVMDVFDGHTDGTGAGQTAEVFKCRCPGCQQTDLDIQRLGPATFSWLIELRLILADDICKKRCK